MRNRLSALAAGALLLAGASVAFAQTIVITPEQETVVRDYVVAQRVEPVALPTDVVVAEGNVLPETVELRVLEVPEIETQYSYVVVDRGIVLVEPDTRRIVRIVERRDGDGEHTQDDDDNTDDDNTDDSGDDTGDDGGDDGSGDD